MMPKIQAEIARQAREYMRLVRTTNNIENKAPVPASLEEFKRQTQPETGEQAIKRIKDAGGGSGACALIRGRPEPGMAGVSGTQTDKDKKGNANGNSQVL
jgi:hypothetical protein